ncbi:EpsG family protein [Flavobacterium luminosum]|uniref:EpsG family protein n=1 Tax=Flavobacterium luminosum TaxID=2949086 RepID=A0ABT0TNR7_9FLAO|nr:EpsG family protein [Flavobacterium sp. HXWNR70]MCL9809120.1 EpsG family protein [Flavobacterium sp. HXWNR70]
MLILLLLFLILFSALELHKKQTFPLLVLFLLSSLAAFIEGIRWYSGTDFFMYYNSYEKVLNATTEPHNTRYEFCYLYLTKGFKILNIPYTLFLLFLSFFSVLLYSNTIRKFTIYPLTGLLVYFVSIIGFWGSNRQLIAMAIVFFGMNYLMEKKYIKFIVLVLLASCFHTTAITMLFLLLLVHKIDFKKWMILGGGVILLSFLPLESIVIRLLDFNSSFFPYFKERFIVYSQFNEAKVDFFKNLLGLIRKAMPIVFLILFKNKLQHLKGYVFFLNISIVSFLVFFLASLNFTYLLGRFTIYFSIYECIIYSWIGYIVLDKDKWIKYSSLSLFYFFCVFSFFRSLKLYQELFIPYKTIFFTF